MEIFLVIILIFIVLIIRIPFHSSSDRSNSHPNYHLPYDGQDYPESDFSGDYGGNDSWSSDGGGGGGGD